VGEVVGVEVAAVLVAAGGWEPVLVLKVMAAAVTVEAADVVGVAPAAHMVGVEVGVAVEPTLHLHLRQ
jgi:hypothetical protein